MDPSEAKLVAYVKFPPLRSSQIPIGTFVNTLANNYRMEILFDEIDRCIPLLRQMSEYMINQSVSSILWNIDLIISDWMIKAPRLFQLVESTNCFFGISEDDVLENMKVIIPQCFRGMFFRCDSLDCLIPIVVKEVTAKVNFEIAVKMNSKKLYLRCSAEKCECLMYNTMDYMVCLIPKILKCRMHGVCVDHPPPGNIPQWATSTAFLHEDRRLAPYVTFQKGHCEVLYSTWSITLMDILADRDSCRLPEETKGKEEEKNPDKVVSDPEPVSLDSQYEYWIEDSSQSPAEIVYNEDEDEEDKKDTDKVSDPEPVSLDSPCEDQPEASERLDASKQILFLVILAELVLQAMKQSRTSIPQDTISRTVLNLSYHALKQDGLRNMSCSSDNRTIKSISRALFRDLKQKFGSAKALLEAMMSQNQDADDTIVQALQDHLTRAAPPPKKNRFLRFFSRLAQAIRRPFKN